MSLEPGGNRNSVHYDDVVMQAFFYHDEDWYDYGARSHVAVYDPKTFEETHVVDIPCPRLSLATRDEDGNTYFATWDTPATSLLGEAPPPCVAKLDSAGELIETFDPREWTGGRAVNNFRYIGNGKAVANVVYPVATGERGYQNHRDHRRHGTHRWPCGRSCAIEFAPQQHALSRALGSARVPG
jgi:hypothetical protein